MINESKLISFYSIVGELGCHELPLFTDKSINEIKSFAIKLLTKNVKEFEPDNLIIKLTCYYNDQWNLEYLFNLMQVNISYIFNKEECDITGYFEQNEEINYGYIFREEKGNWWKDFYNAELFDVFNIKLNNNHSTNYIMEKIIEIDKKTIKNSIFIKISDYKI